MAAKQHGGTKNPNQQNLGYDLMNHPPCTKLEIVVSFITVVGLFKVDGEWVDVSPLVLLIAVVALEDVRAEHALVTLVGGRLLRWRCCLFLLPLK